MKGEEVRWNLWAGLDKQASRPCCMCKQWGCSREQAASARTGPDGEVYLPVLRRGCITLLPFGGWRGVSATTAHTAGRPQRGSLIFMPMNTQQTHTFFRDEAQTFDLEICYKVIKSLQNLLCYETARSYRQPQSQWLEFDLQSRYNLTRSLPKGCFESRKCRSLECLFVKYRGLGGTG